MAKTAKKDTKAKSALRTISETADFLDIPQHVLRFWETKFPQIMPLKRTGGRRFYRPEDIDVLLQIKDLLYKQGFTIKGALKHFAETKTESSKSARRNEVANSNVAVTSATSEQVSDLIDVKLSQIEQLRSELCELRDILLTKGQ